MIDFGSSVDGNPIRISGAYLFRNFQRYFFVLRLGVSTCLFFSLAIALSALFVNYLIQFALQER